MENQEFYELLTGKQVFVVLRFEYGKQYSIDPNGKPYVTIDSSGVKPEGTARTFHKSKDAAMDAFKKELHNFCKDFSVVFFREVPAIVSDKSGHTYSCRVSGQ